VDQTLNLSPTDLPARRFAFSRGIVFLVALVLLIISMWGMHLYDKWFSRHLDGTAPEIHSGAWGDLQEWNIRLEQPVEFSSFEKIPAGPPVWNFGGLSPQAVRPILEQSGCDKRQVEKILSSQISTFGDLFLKPDKETLLSLQPGVRSKIYLALAKNPANRFQVSPYYIPKGDVGMLFSERMDHKSEVVSLVEKLLYTRNGYTYFSDPGLVLGELKNEKDRTDFLRSLTSQDAVMLRLLIRPDTDLDKPLNYWALSMPGVLLKDLRPLFEGIQRLPEGGSLSILYLLPPLAREHLFTAPLPPEAGGAKLPDCHWTALNYFSLIPDPRMSDNAFASRSIAENYYEIARPGMSGDLVLLVNDQNQVVHSAVYIADDVVFTKNGINYAQPWILMHENDLVGSFSALSPVRIGYFRPKGR